LNIGNSSSPEASIRPIHYAPSLVATLDAAADEIQSTFVGLVAISSLPGAELLPKSAANFQVESGTEVEVWGTAAAVSADVVAVSGCCCPLSGLTRATER